MDLYFAFHLLCKFSLYAAMFTALVLTYAIELYSKISEKSL